MVCGEGQNNPLIIFIMKKNGKYISPEVDVIEVVAEAGFGGSNGDIENTVIGDELGW